MNFRENSEKNQHPKLSGPSDARARETPEDGCYSRYKKLDKLPIVGLSSRQR